MSEAPVESRPEGAPAEDADRSTGEGWLRTMPHLADYGLRVAFAQAELKRLPSGVVAKGLNHICQLAELGDTTAREIVGAFAPTLVDAAQIDKVWSVRTTATVMALMSAARLLRASTPDGHVLDREQDNSQLVMQNAAGKPLSLGERRALARRPSRATLDKLMRDPHPMVTAILLNNPRITEDDVVRMAAYRPAMAKVAAEIAKAWSRSTRVRMALILNPGVPPALTVPLLPLLSRPELARVMRAADVLAVTRATAREHHELRPPMPAHERPPHEH